MTAARPTFGELEARVITLHGEGRFDEALEVAHDAAESFPERVAYTSFWVACIRGVAGEPEKGMRSLMDAVDAGPAWWGPELLREDPDLESLRSLPAFDELVRECERRGRQARAEARAEWTIVEPVGEARTGAGLIALHGRSGNLADSMERWRGATTAGITVVALQSSQMVADGMYCWDEVAIAARDVAGASSTVFGTDEGVVLAGFSQGGGLAVYLTLSRGPVRARGFVSIAPSFGREPITLGGISRLLPGAALAGVRGWMAIGERDDRYRPPAEEVGRALDAAGVATRWSVFEGLGHDYPAPFEGHLSDAVSFVLDPTSSISP